MPACILLGLQVIFSSTSDITQERQNSLCSSSESTSLVDAMNPEGKQEEGGDIPLLKVFDFLEGEEGEQGVSAGFVARVIGQLPLSVTSEDL